MFPLGAAFVLFGYTCVYIAGFRLAGDTRTVLGIIQGANGGTLIRATDSGTPGPNGSDNFGLSDQRTLSGTTGNGPVGTAANPGKVNKPGFHL